MSGLFRGQAAVLADQIIGDLRSRRGLRQEWEGIDEEIRDEIREKWIDMIEETLVAVGG